MGSAPQIPPQLSQLFNSLQSLPSGQPAPSQQPQAAPQPPAAALGGQSYGAPSSSPVFGSMQPGSSYSAQMQQPNQQTNPLAAVLGGWGGKYG